MLRVLIFHPALAPYRVDLFNQLGSLCQLSVIFIRENLINQKFDQSELRSRLTVDHGYLTTGFTVGTRSFRFGVGKRIRAFSPDIVVSHEYSPVTLSVSMLKRRSFGNFKHVVWSADNPMMIKCDGLVRRTLRKWLLRSVDGLLLYTNEVAELYRSQFNYKGPVGIVPNISDGERFRESLCNSDPEVEKTIDRFSLTGKKVVLFVGRLSREKRIDRIIRAFAEAGLQRCDCVLAIIGEGGERADLEKIVAELEMGASVIFGGRHDGAALAAWYRISGVFVLASEFEPFGAVVGEALLAGMPVVCSKMAGACVLIDEGRNGSVVDAADSLALRSQLLKWLEYCSPISIAQLSGLRPSLMAASFQGVVDSYAGLLRVVSENSHNNGSGR